MSYVLKVLESSVLSQAFAPTKKPKTGKAVGKNSNPDIKPPPGIKPETVKVFKAKI